MSIKEYVASHWWLWILAIVFIILIISIISFIIGEQTFKINTSKEIESLINDKDYNKVNEKNIIVEKDLDNLPPPVYKWLSNSNLIGRRRIKSMSLSQNGEMRLNPDQENWIKSEANQFINVENPGYLWEVNLNMMPLIKTRGRDLFFDGKADMKILLGSIFPIVNIKDNHKLNESSLHRFLIEICWYPSAALEDYMSWEPLDKNSAKGIISYKNIVAEAIYYFDDEGNPIKVQCNRYKDSDLDSKRIPCIGEIKDYTIVDGIKIPSMIDVTWLLDGVRFTWYKLKIFNIKIQS